MEGAGESEGSESSLLSGLSFRAGRGCFAVYPTDVSDLRQWGLDGEKFCDAGYCDCEKSPS